MKHLNKKILAIGLCCLLTIGCVLSGMAESVVNQVNQGKIKAAETKIFSFDTELTAWSTARVHTIDVQNAREGSGCYSVTYNSNATTHQIVGSAVGAFDLNVKDIQHTALKMELFVSDHSLIAPLYSQSVPMLVAQLHDINGRILQWEIPCTSNGWISLEMPMWNTDSTLQEEAAFNFNRIVKFAVTGTVFNGLTVKFDHLRLVDYTDTYQRSGAPYGGRLIADFDQGTLEGMVFDAVSGSYNTKKDEKTNGPSSWSDYLRLEKEGGSSIELRGLAMPMDLKNDVFCFALYLEKADDISSAKLVLEDSGVKLSVTDVSVLDACANDGAGLRKGINLIRIPLSEMTRSGSAQTMTLRRVSLTLYGARKESSSQPASSQPASSSQNASQTSSQATREATSTAAASASSTTSAATSSAASSQPASSSLDPSQHVASYSVDQMYLTTQELLKGEADKLGVAPGLGNPCELKMTYSNPTENSISSSSVSLITGSTATISIHVAGSYDILQAGVYWGEVSYNLDYRTTANIQNPQNKLITIDLLGLKPQKTYFFQTYIVTEKGEMRGEVLSFTTTTGLTVTTRCTAGGTVSPAGITTVKQGESLTVTITPDAGYYLAALTVDEVLTNYSKEDSISQYTFTDISTGHVLYAQFEPLDAVTDPVTPSYPSTDDTTDDSSDEDSLLKILLWVILSIAIVSIALMLLLPLLSKHKKDDADEDGEDDEDDVQQALGAAAAAAVAEETLNHNSSAVTPEQIPDVAPVQPPVPFVMPVDSFPVGTPTDEDDLSGGFQVNLSFEDDEEGL